MGIAAPYKSWPFQGIVVGIVIFRKTDGQALILIPLVFPGKGAQVVFEMTQDENAAGFFIGNDIDTLVWGPGKDVQLRAVVYRFIIDGRMAGHGNEVTIIEAAKQRMIGHGGIVLVHAEELLRQNPFLHAIITIETRLGGPAEMEGGEDVGIGPFEIFQHFRPVFHFFIGHLFHRRPGDDETVIFPVFDFIKGEIIFFQIRPVRMGRLAGCDAGEIHIDLERRIAQEPEQLHFRGLLDGHEIQD